MDLLIKSLIGFGVGTLIGMTGVGGGVLLLPILIFGLGVPPLRAVGSDALFNFVTKIGASIVHLRKGTVRRKVVLALAAGSAPGSFLGVSFLIHLRNVYGNGVNHFITVAVGVLLICIPTFLFFQKKIEDHVAVRPPTMKSFVWMSVIGLVAGFLVGITSVGSGSIVMMMLLLFYSFHPKVMVGTDIVHALLLTGVTSLLHFRMHNVDVNLVGALGAWFDTWGSCGFLLEHAGSSTVAEKNSVRRVAGNRRAHADGLMETMRSTSYASILQRIHAALEASRAVFARFTPGAIETEYKAGHDPVTEADRALDAVLRKELLRDEEGWLSEESVDDPIRLQRSRVWVVDPLDGTREFVKGIPEFCVSIGFVESGRPVAGGIYNPATDETFLGSLDSGVVYNGKPAQPSRRKSLDGALVLASRSEVKRGEWKPFENAAFTIRPMGSVAYKLALVSAGLADITFTLTPKNEWDVVAGAALVKSAGAFVSTLEKTDLTANRRDPLLSGLLASGPFLKDDLLALVEPHLHASTRVDSASY